MKMSAGRIQWAVPTPFDANFGQVHKIVHFARFEQV